MMLTDLLEVMCGACSPLPKSKEIHKIYRNIEKQTTVVVWADGDKTKVKCAKEDFDNSFYAVAAALMIREYGSNSAFKKHLNKNLGWL